MNRNSIFFLLAATCVAGMAIWFATRVEDGAAPHPATPAGEARAEGATKSEFSTPPTAASLTEPIRTFAASSEQDESEKLVRAGPRLGGTTGDVLEDFYGAEFEALRPELEKRVRLSIALNKPLPPWESILGLVEAGMQVSDVKFERWKRHFAPPDPITVEHLTQIYQIDGLAIDQRDINALEALLVEPRAEVDDRMDQIRALTNTVLHRMFRAGQYNFGPFTAIRTDKLPKRAFYADSVGIQDWVISFGIGEEEDPGFEPLLQDLDSWKKKIRGIVAQYLKEKRSQ
jgi:hypothetical protein